MEKQLVWARNMGEVESLGISKEGQTVLAILMEPQIWHLLANSVGGGFSKGTVASACLDAKHFNFSQCASDACQAVTLVLEPRGSESE